MDVASECNWAKNDTGHNEGAGCGAGVLAKIGGFQIPHANILPLGDIWKRREMMYAALEAFKRGYHNEAVDVAICAQIHNRTSQEFLQNNRDGVAKWFEDWATS